MRNQGWIGWIVMIGGAGLLHAAAAPDVATFTNSLGMKMVRIEAGRFLMGSADGEWDERPTHEVIISTPFHLGVTEVTNAQYEQFDPGHKELRGKLGYSLEDNEAVVFVSWDDATAFCKWLSEKEGRPYHLPTETQWEYACRAGTATQYFTGNELPEVCQKNAQNSWFPSSRGAGEVVPLHVGKTRPNPWGLRDMHGNVEEWCLDWYGPYEGREQTDPVGWADGDFCVTRGGSHSTTAEYLRSANRSGALPKDKHWLIGFRVALGSLPQTKPFSGNSSRRWAGDVRQDKADWSQGPDPTTPYFKGPIQYVKIPSGSEGPLYSRHNHCPALVACPNGDLLAIWYSCRTEPGRELGIVASRLRRGSDQWEEADPFWDTPDRNDHASALYLHENGTIFHFNGLGAAGTWGALATITRTSTNNGVTWSRATLIMPEHGVHHMPIESVFRTKKGYIIVPCDAETGGNGGSAILISKDGGKTWTDPGEGRSSPKFTAGETGAWIAGIHAGVLQLRDGRLMALGRGNTINGKMPMSLSEDTGQTWTYHPSVFPPIGGGQRLVLTRLNEGPIFLASFATDMGFTDAAGGKFTGSGLFAALSYDEGRTWDIRRLITAGGPARRVDGGGNTGMFTMSDTSAEPKGYMSVHQTPDNVIHLISSKQYYAFNLAWLQQDPPPPPPALAFSDLKPKVRLDTLFEADRLPTQAGWRFNGLDVTEDKAVDVVLGTLRILTASGQRVRWVGDSPENFGAARGAHTAEITMRVTRSTGRDRGIDFETCIPAVGRAFLTVTTSAVLWYDGAFEPLAEGLDNASAMHTYRIAADAAGNVLVFRDNRLLGTRRAHASRDNIGGAQGAYLQWGEGAAGSEADAIVDAVAFDLTGAYRPGGAPAQEVAPSQARPASAEGPKAEAGGELRTAPVNNRNYDKTRAPRLAVERRWLYRPEKEWTYSHHPHLGLFKGRLYAMWSNGMEHEDRSGQRVFVCHSDDFHHWTEPEVLAAPEPPSRVLTAAGFYGHEGVLAAYFGDYGPNKETTKLKVRTTTDGKTWSDVKDVGIPVSPNYGPQKTASGRLIICGNVSYPYTDDPSGLIGWTMTGIFPPEMAGMSDDPASFRHAAQANGAALCEGSFYQTDDGVLHMLLRCTRPFEGRLWITESRDNGRSWSRPAKTEFSDNCAKFHTGRLSDGRFYYVGNPDPRGSRCPLVLSLSRDGVSFDRHFVLADELYQRKRNGEAKGGQYGYPHTLIHEGRLYVIASRLKEAVEVLRVDLKQL